MADVSLPAARLGRRRLALPAAVADRIMLGLALACAAFTVTAGALGWPS